MPLSLFGIRTIALASAGVFVLGMAMFGMFVYLPLYLQGVLGMSAAASGTLFVPMIFAMILASVASGQIVSRTGRYKLLAVGGAVLVNGRHGAAGAARDRRARRRRSCGAWSCAASASAPRSRSTRWRCRTRRRAPSSARPPPPASSSARSAAPSAWRCSARCCWASTTSGWRRRCRSTRRPQVRASGRQPAQHEPAGRGRRRGARCRRSTPAVAAGVRASLAAGMQRIFVLAALVMASSVVLNALLPELPLRSRADHAAPPPEL